MTYTQKKFNNRYIFYFEDKNLTYEEVVGAIDLTIAPDEKSEDEITSWTVSFTFRKENIEVYFEHFHSPDHYFSFELYPLGNNSEENIIELGKFIEQLDHYLYKKR
ncbi:hypothetical protein D0T84_03070 [Dysgonomonas sp. 521]|uniref:hypothetical protein n=1 Tax=Dysgonomonas sp. 521 TaxID=2302932 RepID=UPI0013D4D8A9|nr:hypothetical protein [Dysgonomonas sp. 521]NDV93900.1 hypothetical protein [Dysgonomonas sp. 521]